MFSARDKDALNAQRKPTISQIERNDIDVYEDIVGLEIFQKFIEKIENE